MANTFVINDQTVMGSWRALSGTLTMTDGAAGSTADTGLHRIMFAADNSDTQAHISHTAGAIIATTAASGVALDVFILGV